MAITYFCPACWITLTGSEERCPDCGFVLADFNRLSYEDKLVLALQNPVKDTRYNVVEILGKLGSQKALPGFQEFLQDPQADYYLLRTTVDALAKIEGPASAALLEMAARHPNQLIQERARRLLAERDQKHGEE